MKPDIAAMIKARRALDMQAARSTILSVFETRAEAAGRSWREAAQELIAAVDAASCGTIPAQHREIVEFALPCTILREAKGWGPKDGAWSVSLRLLYTWKGNAAGRETPPRAFTTGATGSFEEGFRAASAFLCSSPDVVLEFLVGSDEARFVEIMKRCGYQVERVQSGPVQSGS